MFKNGKEQNVVPTSREQNLACAKLELSYPMACLLFKRLQWANNMGTTKDDYDELEQYFIYEQNWMYYCENGFTATPTSDKKVYRNSK
jgi:hypothetical protein